MDLAVKPLMEANLLSQLIELTGMMALLRKRGVAPDPACEQQVGVTRKAPSSRPSCHNSAKPCIGHA